MFVYTRAGNTNSWTMQKQLYSIDPFNMRNFGWSIAAHGTSNALMVGAPSSMYSPSKPGYVVVYTTSPTNKTVITYNQTLQALSPQNSDNFGYSIALGVDAAFIVNAFQGLTISYI